MRKKDQVRLRPFPGWLKEVHWRGHFYARAFTFRLTIFVLILESGGPSAGLFGAPMPLLVFLSVLFISIGSFPDYRWPTTFVHTSSDRRYNARHNAAAPSRKTIDSLWESWNDPKLPATYLQRTVRVYVAIESHALSESRNANSSTLLILWSRGFSINFAAKWRLERSAENVLCSLNVWKKKYIANC